MSRRMEPAQPEPCTPSPCPPGARSPACPRRPRMPVNRLEKWDHRPYRTLISIPVQPVAHMPAAAAPYLHCQRRRGTISISPFSRSRVTSVKITHTHGALNSTRWQATQSNPSRQGTTRYSTTQKQRPFLSVRGNAATDAEEGKERGGGGRDGIARAEVTSHFSSRLGHRKGPKPGEAGSTVESPARLLLLLASDVAIRWRRQKAHAIAMRKGSWRLREIKGETTTRSRSDKRETRAVN